MFWHTHYDSYGIEEIAIDFPHRPYVDSSFGLELSYAYEGAALYSFTACYPPVHVYDPFAWFDELLAGYHPIQFTLLFSDIYASHDEMDDGLYFL